jgi:hypothetical protein
MDLEAVFEVEWESGRCLVSKSDRSPTLEQLGNNQAVVEESGARNQVYVRSQKAISASH